MTTMPTTNEKTIRLPSSVPVTTEAADAANTSSISPPPLASLLFAIQNAFIQLDDDDFEAECAIEQSRRQLPFVHALRHAFLHLQEHEFESVIASERLRRDLETSNGSNNYVVDVKSKARKPATKNEQTAAATADKTKTNLYHDDESFASKQVDAAEALGRCLNNENNINNNTKQAAVPATTTRPDNDNSTDNPTLRSINKKKRPPTSSESSDDPLSKKHKKAVVLLKDLAPYSTLIRSDATTPFSARAQPRGPDATTAEAVATTTTTTTTTTIAPTGIAMCVAPYLPNPALQWMLWNHHQPVTVSHVVATTTTASNVDAQGQIGKKYTLTDTLPLAYRTATTGNAIRPPLSNAKKGQAAKSTAATTTKRGERSVAIKSTTQQQQLQQTLGIFGWTPEEDWRLTDIVKKHRNPVNWEPIAKELGGNRTARECHERWIRYLKPGFRKGQWTAQEDAIVAKAVMDSKERPFARWSELADQLPGRVGKQIRDRWINHLNPDINHLPFSRDDDLLLWTAHAKVGKKWVEIAATFFKASRSENQIKNRWHSAAFKQVIAEEFGPQAYESGIGKSSSSDQSCSSMTEAKAEPPTLTV